MESALSKLQVLSYETLYLGNSKPALTRTHFCQPGANLSLQFQEFIDLTVWLVALIKRDNGVFVIDKYDDPNTAVNKMLIALRSLEYTGDFPANKLKAAHGDAVCHVLDFLTDKALEATGFVWGTPKHEVDDQDAGDDGDDGADADDDDIEDEIEVAEEDAPMFAAGEDENIENNENNNLIDSNVDPIEWKTELERVGPRLRTNNAQAGKEWRSHIEQTKKHSLLINNELPNTEITLKQINNQLASDVASMKTKEKYVNSQYTALAEQYQRVKEGLTTVESEHSKASEEVSGLTMDLAVIADQLSEIKGTMDSRGSSMTDTTPLVKIRAALQDIKVEINHFELRIGVVGHTLLAAQTSTAQNENEGIIANNDDSLDEDFEGA
jgi:estrogen-related receptor beta like 1